MHVYWLAQTEADVPQANNWLSAEETVHFNTLRFAKRSADWRLGRWTAKRAIAAFLNFPVHPQALANIEIWPAPSGAPEAFVANALAPVVISISHRDGRAMCAIASSRVDLGADLGCDLEIIEPHSDAFVADYFAPEEQALIAHSSPSNRELMMALLWSAKESALKAMREGLRLDTRSVIVRLIGDVLNNGLLDNDRSGNDSPSLNRWNRLQVHCANGQTFHGWWRNTKNVVLTVVASPRPDSPIFLDVSVDFPQYSSSSDIQERRQTITAAVSRMHR
ncbi:MAG: 4'-phosphopantetheinyl transferase superfamily protein [Terriglobales bacterium]